MPTSLIGGERRCGACWSLVMCCSWPLSGEERKTFCVIKFVQLKKTSNKYFVRLPSRFRGHEAQWWAAMQVEKTGLWKTAGKEKKDRYREQVFLLQFGKAAPCVKPAKSKGRRSANIKWSLRKVHEKKTTPASNHRVHAYQDEHKYNR